MEVAFRRASFFKKFIKSFDRVVNEFLFVCDANGIQYAGMDTAQVVLVAFELRPDVFERYVCKPSNGRSEIAIGLSQNLLSRYLQIIPDECILEIQESGDRLKIHCIDDEVEFSSHVGILELHREFHNAPSDSLYATTVCFPSVQLQNVIRDVAAIDAESITITIEPGKCPMVSDDDITQREAPCIFDENTGDMDNTSAHMEKPSTIKLEGTSCLGSVHTTFIAGVDGFNLWYCERRIVQSFPLRFLREHALKFCSLCNTVSMSLGGNTNPLKLKFPLEELSNDCVRKENSKSGIIGSLAEKFIKNNDPDFEDIDLSGAKCQQSYVAFYLSSLREACGQAGRQQLKLEGDVQML